MQIRLIFILSLIVLFCPQVAVADDFTVYVGRIPPFTYIDELGVARGAAVDVVLELMNDIGKPVDRKGIKYLSWARAVEDAETIPGTMLFCIARTPQREAKFKWVGPIAELNLGLIAEKSRNIVIKSKDDVKRYNIGVIRNSAPLQLLELSYNIPKSKITLLSSDELQFKMLKERRVDLVTQADTAAPSFIKNVGLDPDDFEMVHVMNHLKLYVAFNKQTDDLVIGDLQKALEKMKTPKAGGKSRYDEIMAHYFADGFIAVRQ